MLISAGKELHNDVSSSSGNTINVSVSFSRKSLVWLASPDEYLVQRTASLQKPNHEVPLLLEIPGTDQLPLGLTQRKRPYYLIESQAE
jgi:hypothetical protein